MKELLSLKQKEVLRFIRRKITEDNFPPTIREIAGHFHFSSTGTVRDYLGILAKKGYLKLKKQKARAIELVEDIFKIPLLGRVNAGSPQIAEQDIEGYLEPDEFLKSTGDLFALRVKGDSMVDAGIIEGDLVVVRRQPQAQNGEIVVAIIGDEATVKFFKKINKGLFLFPANKKYKPIAYSESTAILGRVIRVLRKYV
jgi:repressor LexA